MTKEQKDKYIKALKQRLTAVNDNYFKTSHEALLAVSTAISTLLAIENQPTTKDEDE